MDLGVVAKHKKDQSFEQLMPDGSFSAWTVGRLAPVDRFLSNFHKPLQRRMLFTNPDVAYPDIKVIRQVATGEVYLLGQSREDVQGDTPYDRLSVLHDVGTNSADRVEYFNYNGVNPDTALDGEIGKVSEGFHYIALEYISTKSAEYGDEAYQGKLIAYSADGMPFKRDGVFTLNGSSFKVVESYVDSGFSCAVVLEQEDDMVQITHKVIDNTTSGYDVTTGVTTLNYLTKRYPASVDQSKLGFNRSEEITVYIKNPTIGKFRYGDIITYNTKDYIVTQVNSDNNTQGQVQLVCEGS